MTTAAPKRPDPPPLQWTTRDVSVILCHIRDEAEALVETAKQQHADLDPCRGQLADLRQHHDAIRRMLNDVEVVLRKQRLAPLVGVVAGVVFIGTPTAEMPEWPATGTRGTLQGIQPNGACRVLFNGKAVLGVNVVDLCPCW